MRKSYLIVLLLLVLFILLRVKAFIVLFLNDVTSFRTMRKHLLGKRINVVLVFGYPLHVEG